ncbi:phospho-acceptor domain-containing protein [Pseudaminobacter salicylatoxidans]|uniref:histidine kinase n=1 Tax=Pseudaminobacter salicylatoxidans TaxID=93369 RepID=A0A316C6W1_PSESE|nr:ATP-binding protein [Pseudaminobacter salicylatoxidans]PWJ83747.1 phospho-acceptor domain-containing protein [Pseudaminobacter salicylatoxidans]
MTGNRPTLENPFRLIVGGVLLLLCAAGILAMAERQSLIAELEQESIVLHRLASQQADQHDAHMTALSAIAVAANGARHDLFLDVAATISRFYPRIDEVQLVPLFDQGEIIGTERLDPALAATIRAAAMASDGRIALLPHPGKPHHYIMVKRSPNSEAARYGLMLGIDAERLLDEAGSFWQRPGIALGLSLPGSQKLTAYGGAPQTIHFSQPLGSASQPLVLQTGMEVRLADLFPPVKTVLVLLAVALAYVAALIMLRQRARTRRALEQVRLSALDSRLAHASRVNALGEMASGLAHELTQPLTAILAQAQAGRRLLILGDTAALAPTLDDTVTQARRASAMLERFRNWSRPQHDPVSAFDLREAVANVRTLLEPQAMQHGVQLIFDVPETSVAVAADSVEMEQVVFNLVRNAIEAAGYAGSGGRVTIQLRRDVSHILLEVTDNGPGVPEELRPRLFTPFTTTRPDGTGLGLALSQRLVERAGGEIALVDRDAGATFRVVLPRKQDLMEVKR